MARKAAGPDQRHAIGEADVGAALVGVKEGADVGTGAVLSEYVEIGSQDPGALAAGNARAQQGQDIAFGQGIQRHTHEMTAGRSRGTRGWNRGVS